jgi:hypothetical protein
MPFRGASCESWAKIGNEKLAKLTTPRVHAFRDELLRTCSRQLARSILSIFKSIIAMLGVEAT